MLLYIDQSENIQAEFDLPDDPMCLYAEDVIEIQRRIGAFINDIEAVEDEEFDSKFYKGTHYFR